MKFIYSVENLTNPKVGHHLRAVDDNSSTLVSGSRSLRELLSINNESRDIKWLQEMLQHAIELEFATLPPYLFAMWSIRDPSSPASLFLSQITKQEMLHMGIACNLLATIQGKPNILSAHIQQPYPKSMPGGILPGLTLDLYPMSKTLVCDVFMEIEKPDWGPVALFRGETYPTIGSFYSSISAAFQSLSSADVTGANQITLRRPGIELRAITTINEAIDAITLIAEQGEGTASSPLYSPNPEDKAHYYLFGELYNEKLLVQLPSGDWSYSGADLPFPQDIYSIGSIPAEGYPQSAEFNKEFSDMLRQLHKAWEVGGAVGQQHLLKSLDHMIAMTSLATELMQTNGPSGNFAPTFRYT